MEIYSEVERPRRERMSHKLNDEIHFEDFWRWMLRHWRVQQLPLLREKSDKKIMSLIKSSEGQSFFFPLLFFFFFFLDVSFNSIFSFYSRKLSMSLSMTQRAYLICMCHCYLVIVPLTIADLCLCLYRFYKKLKPMYVHVSRRFLRLDSCATRDI